MLTLPERYNVSSMLDAQLTDGRGERIAIYWGDETITYGDLLDRVCRMGRALLRVGVRKEHRVLLVLGDSPSFVVAFLGAIRIGAIPVPVNPLYKVADFRFFLQDSEAEVVITDEVFLPKVVAAVSGSPVTVSVISTGHAEPGVLSMADLLQAESGELPVAATHRDDMAFWLYSSGSTGKPKAVVHLQHDIPWTCETVGRHVLQLREDDIVFARVLFHAYGLGNAISFPLSVGAAAVLHVGPPTPHSLLQTIERFRPTVFCSVPTLFNAILSDPATARYDLSSLRLCLSAAEALPAHTFWRWKERFGSTILDGIGSTEMLHMFCCNTLSELRPGSSGKAVPGYEMRLLNQEGQAVAPGEVGDLLVRGESAAPYYWRQHERSKKTMLGEWVVTGDRYRVDADGFYFYEGRSDDLVKVGGEWVSPIEIENTLLEHPAIHEVAVVGTHVDGLQRIKAVVVPAAGYHGSESLTAALQEFCKARLQRYQFPHVIAFVDTLPKTQTGKIQRFLLRDS
jgi:benzoate-CoA ligase